MGVSYTASIYYSPGKRGNGLFQNVGIDLQVHTELLPRRLTYMYILYNAHNFYIGISYKGKAYFRNNSRVFTLLSSVQIFRCIDLFSNAKYLLVRPIELFNVIHTITRGKVLHRPIT